MKKTKKHKIKDLLDRLQPGQVKVFYAMYTAVEAVPEKKLDWAIKQCEITLDNNNINKLKDLLHVKYVRAIT